MTHGIVSRLTAKDLVSDAPADQGNSGGPILNESGALIGVTSMRSPSLTLSPSPAKIREFVQGGLAELAKGNVKKPSVLFAHGNSVLNLVYLSDAFLRKESGSNAPAWGLEVGYDFWDRLRFSYSATFLRPERVQGLNLGTVTRFEFGAFSSMDLLGGAGWQNYRIGNKNTVAPKVFAGLQLFNLFQFTLECVFARGHAYPAMRISL